MVRVLSDRDLKTITKVINTSLKPLRQLSKDVVLVLKFLTEQPSELTPNQLLYARGLIAQANAKSPREPKDAEGNDLL